MGQLKEELQAILKGEVSDDPAILEKHSHDASIFELMPQLVVAPRDGADVARLVSYVIQTNQRGGRLSLTPRAGATDMSGGSLTRSIAVSLTEHFTNIGKISKQTITVEPGVYYRDFEKITLANGLLLPSFPASRDICTVGGMVANNAGGEKTLRYGKTEDYVEQLTMVTGDGSQINFRKLSFAELKKKKGLRTFEGEIYRKMDKLLTEQAPLLAKARPRVSKNSAGYALWNVIDPSQKTFDLTKLLVGSQGTLGIITDMTFRLIEPKRQAVMLVIFLSDVDQLVTVTKQVLKYHPESFEAYDHHTLAIALRYLPELAKQMGRGIVTLAWQFLPELGMALRGGLPELVLLAEFTSDRLADAQVKARTAEADLTTIGLPTRVITNRAEMHKYWTIRRESFNLLRRHVRGLHTAPFIDDMIVPPAALSNFLPRLYTLLDHYQLLYTITGHIGDGNLHIIPLMDIQAPETRSILQELARKVYRLVLDFDGSITAEHNDGLVRGAFLPQMFGPKVYQLFQETKQIFDPQNIFNPGKKVNVDFAFALRHLRQHWE